MDALNLSELFALFDADNRRRVNADKLAERTRDYYNRLLAQAVKALGGGRKPQELRAGDLHRAGLTGWHQVQAMQRLLNWAQDLDLVATNPLARMKKETRPGRTRVLTRVEWAGLLAGVRPALRRFLQFQRLTLCRPGEARAARWRDYDHDASTIVLQQHKTRRTAAVKRPRVIVLPVAAVRLVEGVLPADQRAATGHILLNEGGRPWTTNALRIAVRRACRRLGLDGEGGERIVAYTVRHTGATAATAAGVRDRQLADLMGHASTRTTARYQHLDVEHLREAAERCAA